MKQSYNYSSNRNRKSNRNYSPADGHANVPWRLLYECIPHQFIGWLCRTTIPTRVCGYVGGICFANFSPFFAPPSPPPSRPSHRDIHHCWHFYMFAAFYFLLRALYQFLSIPQGSEPYHTYNVSDGGRRGQKGRELALAKLHCNVSNSSFFIVLWCILLQFLLFFSRFHRPATATAYVAVFVLLLQFYCQCLSLILQLPSAFFLIPLMLLLLIFGFSVLLACWRRC